MSTKPKKAPTKAEEPKFLKGWVGKVVRNEVLDVAIKRGERLEKIVEIIDQWRITSDEGYDVIKQIYKLAKGS